MKRFCLFLILCSLCVGDSQASSSRQCVPLIVKAGGTCSWCKGTGMGPIPGEVRGTWAGNKVCPHCHGTGLRCMCK